MLCLVNLELYDRNTLSKVANICAGMDPWLRLGIDADKLLALYSSKPTLHRTCSTIHINGEIAGILCLQYPWLKGVYIEQFALFPEYQQSGFGKQVICLIEEEYRPKTKNLWLLVSAFNSKALEFYQSQGFMIIGLIPDFIKQGEDEIFMRKTLVPAIKACEPSSVIS